MTLYVIAIGGSGTRCLESLTFTAATGIIKQEDIKDIKVVFVDADTANSNLERTQNVIKTHNICHDLLKPLGNESNIPDFDWMKTKIEDFGVWSPIGSDKEINLAKFFGKESYTVTNPILGNLLDILYKKEDQQFKLDVGFRARPAIGSPFMAQLLVDSDQNLGAWKKFIDEIRNELAGDGGDTKSGVIKILLCGSIFGGTGASGFPVVARFLSELFENIAGGQGRDRLMLGGILILPYFSFRDPKDSDVPDGVYGHWQEFLLNTESALRYYEEQAKDIFDVVYMLGNQTLTPMEFGIGSNQQKNPPHFIELYAALAASDFATAVKPAKRGEIVTISVNDSAKITWADIPNELDVRKKLGNATRFAFSWLSVFYPDFKTAAKIENAREINQSAPWLTKFFNFEAQPKRLPKLGESEKSHARNVTIWCIKFLSWLAPLHDVNGDGKFDKSSIQLFNPQLFGVVMNFDPDKDDISEESPRLNPANLENLIVGTYKANDTIQRQKEEILQSDFNRKIIAHLNSYGTVGLAKSLYVINLFTKVGN